MRAQQVGGDVEKFIGNFIEIPEDTQLQAWYPENLQERVRTLMTQAGGWRWLCDCNECFAVFVTAIFNCRTEPAVAVTANIPTLNTALRKTELIYDSFYNKN